MPILKFIHAIPFIGPLLYLLLAPIVAPLWVLLEDGLPAVWRGLKSFCQELWAFAPKALKADCLDPASRQFTRWGRFKFRAKCLWRWVFSDASTFYLGVAILVGVAVAVVTGTYTHWDTVHLALATLFIWWGYKHKDLDPHDD